MNTSAKAGDYHPKMGVRDRFLTGLARQLGRPDGMRGRFVARGLNRGNRGTVTAAVDATGVGSGQTAADIGFGGGVGLPLLLVRVLPGGHVHGVDLSDTMLDRAKRRYRKETLAGSLTLHAGSITALPLSDESLDAAITVNTIYFVADLDQAFTELARVLRPSGRVVVGLGDPAVMAKLPFTAHGFTLRPVEDVVASLTKAGLTILGHPRIGQGGGAYHLLVAGRTLS
ncbi:MAG: class I SAM-dependent methyltransferase [Actinomycetota bacterium]|nr:class I SAM-dependent methyltransferase [Actinomycetota bacterium]